MFSEFIFLFNVLAQKSCDKNKVNEKSNIICRMKITACHNLKAKSIIGNIEWKSLISLVPSCTFLLSI